VKITLEPTAEFFRTDEGFPVRAWIGTTDQGTRITAFIAAIASRADDDQAQLQAELEEIPGPGSPFVVEWEEFTGPTPMPPT